MTSTRYLLTFTCLLACTVAMEIPNWKELREKLHEKLEDIYNDREEVQKHLEVGKYFKYYLSDVGSFTVSVIRLLFVFVFFWHLVFF